MTGVFDGQRKLDHTTERLKGGFKVSMETGRNLEDTTERHQRGFKVPMEMGSMFSLTAWDSGFDSRFQDTSSLSTTSTESTTVCDIN